MGSHRRISDLLSINTKTAYSALEQAVFCMLFLREFPMGIEDGTMLIARETLIIHRVQGSVGKFHRGGIPETPAVRFITDDHFLAERSAAVPADSCAFPERRFSAS